MLSKKSEITSLHVDVLKFCLDLSVQANLSYQKCPINEILAFRKVSIKHEGFPPSPVHYKIKVMF